MCKSSRSGLFATIRHRMVENIYGGAMVCGENVGRSSRSGRIATTHHKRDGWKIFMAVLWCVVKMSADRPDRDGLRRPITSVTDGDNS